MFQSSINLDQVVWVKLLKANTNYDSSGILMPLQDIVNAIINFCGCDTMIFPPASTPSETDAKNYNHPKKKQKKRKKSPKFSKSSKCAWQKQWKQGRRSTKNKKTIVCIFIWYILYKYTGQRCRKSRTNTIGPIIIHLLSIYTHGFPSKTWLVWKMWYYTSYNKGS